MAGSSKGGTAALYFAGLTNADDVICGAPQYFIGDYLNTQKHYPILEGILGEVTPDGICRLNQLVKDTLIYSNKKSNIHIHYSKKEHTFQEHITYLLEDLYNCGGFQIKEDIRNYKNHNQVAEYFGQFLIQECNKILEKG